MQNKGSLQHRFDSFGAEASPEVWNGIASKLDQNKRKKGLIIWWTTTGVAACLLTVFGLQFMKMKSTQNQAKKELPQPKQQEWVDVSNQNNSNSNNNEEPIANSQNEMFTDNNNEKVNETNTQTQKINSNVKYTKKKVSKDQNTTDKPTKNLEPTTLKKEDITINDNIEIEKLKREINADLLQNQDEEELVIQNINYVPKQKSEWVFGAKIQTQISILNPTQNQNDLSYFTSLDATSNAFVSSSALSIKTNRPLTFRFELKRKNKKRFNFKTGIDVGWLNTQSTESTYSYRNSIITLGVPIKLDFKMLEKKRFSLNSDIGLVNDIPFLEFDKNELANESTSQNISFVSGFMGGLEVGLNANYNLNENFQVTAGTGLKWYYLQQLKASSPILKQNVFANFNLGLIWRY